MKLRWWKTADEKADLFAATRQPQADEGFIADCGLIVLPTTYDRRVALAVRRSVATYGMIDPLYIRAGDRFPDQLIHLSGWDSIDFLAWSFELEKELQMKVPKTVWQRLKGPGFSVRDLIQSVLDEGPLKPY